MTTAKIVLVGGALGLVGVGVWKYLSADTSIDPTTGGVQLAPGQTYGPPAPSSDSSDSSIDPTTGGTTLPDGDTYGPQASDGTVVTGLV